MAPKGRHHLGQKSPWQRGSFLDKSLLGENFLAKNSPGQKVFWGRRSLGNRPLRVVQINMKNVEEYHLLLFYKFCGFSLVKKIREILVDHKS